MQNDNIQFSVFRSQRGRETLGALPMPNNMNSGIPMPASALKRSNSGPRASTASNRLSFAPQGVRASVGGAVAELPGVKRFSSSARKSYAPGSSQQQSTQGPTSVRRNSQYGRPSMGYSHANSFFNTAAQTAIPQRDPRPLRDPSYKAKVGQEIMDFLLQNGFEMDMKHQLPQNALRSPTQKDFVLIFEWLYTRLDPNYRFVKVENEILGLLKQLRYPYANSVTKSQLTAVGSQNSWHIFLGMLHWLMELVNSTDRYESGDFDDAVVRDGIDIVPDKIIFRYTTHCYSAFLAAQDDHSELDEELIAAFDQRAAGYRDELAMLEAENTQLKTELLEAESYAGTLRVLEDRATVLSSDIDKFKTYATHVDEKGTKVELSNERIRADIDKMNLDFADAEKKRTELQQRVDAQGLAPDEIDRISSEREKLSKSLAQVAERLNDARKKLSESESEAQKQLDELENAVCGYGKLAYKIGIASSSACNAQGTDYAVDILPLMAMRSSDLARHDSGEINSALLYDAATGYQPSQVLSKDLRNVIKPSILSFRSEIAQRINNVQDEMQKGQDKIERLKEDLQDCKQELENKQASLGAVKDEYGRTKETLETEGIKNAQLVESRMRDLADMRVSVENGLMEADQKLASVKMQKKQLKLAVRKKQGTMHAQVQKLIDDVITFKVHCQESLEDYDERTHVALTETEALVLEVLGH